MKTLKDIIPMTTMQEARQVGKTGMSIYREALRNNLRESAIEWIKYCDFSRYKFQAVPFLKDTDEMGCIEVDIIELDEITFNWIKHFFNITDEDLK